MEECKHDKGMEYAVLKTGVWMVCKLCRLILAEAREFRQVETLNLYEQKDAPKIMEK